MQLGRPTLPFLCTVLLQDAGRPIRYPDRIASNLKDLMAGVDMVLLGLQQMLQQHVVAATKQLRVQVGLARNLLATRFSECMILSQQLDDDWL